MVDETNQALWTGRERAVFGVGLFVLILGVVGVLGLQMSASGFDGTFLNLIKVLAGIAVAALIGRGGAAIIGKAQNSRAQRGVNVSS